MIEVSPIVAMAISNESAHHGIGNQTTSNDDGEGAITTKKPIFAYRVRNEVDGFHAFKKD